MPKVVGVYEIALMLGVTRQRVWKLTQGADFPEPAIRLHMGNAWLLSDVQDWAKRTGRTINKH